MDPKKICDNCEYHKEGPSPLYILCCRYPPVTGDFEYDSRTGIPTGGVKVSPICTCGEWKGRTR